MNKILKKLLFINAGLLMLSSIGIGVFNVHANSHQIHVHRVYRSHIHHFAWYRGTPNVLHHRSYWVSNFLTNKYSKRYPYGRFAFPMSNKKGINLFNFAYKNHHSRALPGSDTSAFAENYPYYKSLGHSKYLITSGDPNVSHKYSHLHYDLESNVYLIKMHGHKHLSLWAYSNRHHRYYLGYYTRYHHNRTLLDKVLKLPRNLDIY